MVAPQPLAHLSLPTWAGEFDLRAYRWASGDLYLLFARGDIGDGRGVLTRLHSGCLTGDALGSLRCDCGPQLRLAMRRLAAEGRGLLLYVPGHEGRGIGLVDKLRAYMLQDQGQDTVEANRKLGLPVDGRDYREAAQVLAGVGVRSVRLLSNNPHKAAALAREGIQIEELVPIQTAPHLRNLGYVETKRQQLGHRRPGGEPLADDGPDGQDQAVDATTLLGDVRPRPNRPYVVLKYAQTLGAGTVLADDPLLTVRMVPGASPIRVVLDSSLRLPADANVFGPDAGTIVLTTGRSSPERRAELRDLGVTVAVVGDGHDGVDLAEGLAELRRLGIRSLLVEGGARVITSMLRARLADRVVVAVAPLLLGKGTEAVCDLGSSMVADGLQLANRTVHQAGPDLLIAGDLDAASPPTQGPAWSPPSV
jgi:3,4-dihydroxy 2-butanone 4-phosphate synthase/GTP cyclohydrolase II